MDESKSQKLPGEVKKETPPIMRWAWLLVPALIIFISFGVGLAIQSYYSVTTAQVNWPLPRLNTVLNIVYPRRIFYGSTEPVPLDISLSCILPLHRYPRIDNGKFAAQPAAVCRPRLARLEHHNQRPACSQRRAAPHLPEAKQQPA